jgi:hypothetical protein
MAAPPAVATISITAAAAAVTIATWWLIWKQHRRSERSKYIQEEIEEETEEGGDTLPSIISHFQDMKLNYKSTISEANDRRTSVYYERARDAHLYDLCLGVRSYPRLRNRREAELKRIMHFHKEGTKSHRTVVCMCDEDTATMLDNAQREILGPLNFSSNVTTSGAWIPELNLIPKEDLHVTVASVWWWHTIRENNRELTEETLARFRQALIFEFHHAFQIELDRIVLLGGKALVALWRCVGERKTADGATIYDRHGEETDPFVKLRHDIVRCFTSSNFGKEPLTYTHRKSSLERNEAPLNAVAATPKTLLFPTRLPKNERANTIELKTPGIGSQDGFIHTTLARLPLDCLSMTDIELDPIHRLCREATATYCGHRMVVSKFRFLETTGAGGESNPCVAPLFDETIDAPVRVEVSMDGEIIENRDLHAAKNVERSATIGALPRARERGSMDCLFDEPGDNTSGQLSSMWSLSLN